MIRTFAELLKIPEDATHFELLGVSPGAPDVDLIAARRAVALMAHPDRRPNSKDAAALMAKANAAFDVLMDPAQRRLYLAGLATTHEPCKTCAGDGRRRQQSGFKHARYIGCTSCGSFGYKRKERRDVRKT